MKLLDSAPVRYLVAGTIGYVSNLVVLLGLVRLAGVDEFVALFPAYVVNTTVNFLLNRHWTFGAGERRASQDLWKFLVVAAILLVWNYATFFVCFELLGMPDVVAQTVSILLGLPLGFALNRAWAFAD